MLRPLRFVNLLLVALTFGLTWCHVMEIPGKLRLNGPEWLSVQHNLYVAFGGPVGAPIEVAAILLTWVVLWRVRSRRAAAAWTLMAAICATLGLIVWFLLVSPMNGIIADLTPSTLSADWTTVRDQWEIGHAVHALMFGFGFGALVAALLAETPP